MTTNGATRTGWWTSPGWSGIRFDGRLVLAGLAALTLAPQAGADLRICNGAPVSASVAVGYNKDDQWTSEGWWNLAPDACATVVSGDLPQRYYYWRATANGAPFDAERFMFCTHAKVFTIVGDEDCDSRGYDRVAFSQIDTGDARDFVFTIPASAAPAGTPATEADPLAEVRAALVGNWRDVEEPDASHILRDDGTIEEFMFGVSLLDGRWRVSGSCPVASGDGPWVLVTYTDTSEQEVVCWRLTQLSRTGLSYSVIGGADFVMQREK